MNMKELSIEEKAKRYDELKVTAQELEHDGCFDKITLFDLFPELKELKNERIRKALIDYFRWNPNSQLLNEFTNREVFDWFEKQGEKESVTCPICGWEIEKQGEQKPAEDVDLPEFESYLCLMFQKFRTKGICTNGEIIDYVKEHSQKLKDILVKPAWSEEDERKIGDIRDAITLDDELEESYKGELYDFLKSLKDRYTWKPSDEQMDVLLSEVTAWTKGCPKQIVLESLYNDLKRLLKI